MFSIQSVQNKNFPPSLLLALSTTHKAFFNQILRFFKAKKEFKLKECFNKALHDKSKEISKG